MASPHHKKFLEAANKEIRELEGKDAWAEEHASEAKSRIIPGTWVFKIK